MYVLRNSFDKDINFYDLADAKQYYLTSEEQLIELDYDENFVARNNEIVNSESLEELADVLNTYSNICDNGSNWYVKEVSCI